jgi:phosphate transport system permease protein
MATISTMDTKAPPSLSNTQKIDWRHWKDRLATVSITMGGLSVLAALLLIFFYLLVEIMPLFRPAELQSAHAYPVPAIAANSPPLLLAVEEQAEVAMRLDQSGRVIFYNVADGALISDVQLPIPADKTITAFALDTDQNHVFALGLNDGSVIVARHNYKLSYPNNKRVITPSIDYPQGQEPLLLADAAIRELAIRTGDSGMLMVANIDNALVGKSWTREEDFMTEEITTTEKNLQMPIVDIKSTRLLLTTDKKWLYDISDSGTYRLIDMTKLKVVDSGRLFTNADLTSSQLLLGGNSILVGNSRGEVSQWFVLRREGEQPRLQKLRTFAEHNDAVQLIAPEQRRKGFLTMDSDGRLGVYYATSMRQLAEATIPSTASSAAIAIATSPRADLIMLETADKQLKTWTLHNEHPEVSWSVLWEKVWYEGYPEPDYIWQSSAANNDFEPKFSFSPLAFGTLKAAFYAMLMAAPLAICAAIYTANFMAPALRTRIKPLIELMAGLPTVIIGFFAGLWLAPYMETHLPGIFCVFLFLPFSILLFAYLWDLLPRKWRRQIPDGWHVIILLPFIVLVIALCLGSSIEVEKLLFGGDMRMWLTNDMGISFDQRNALVVGMAMGFAVIPNIFSIAEDAIFSVPKHLTVGSLALGATPWQTLIGVVLPTASPGIFSALMIGMGRAVGETMIVLMATGNTPIMDANIFEGMRTLASNIAVEIGETEVASTHFRVLFLAAFVLFLFTFVINTIAEVVRQRLRVRYGSL